MAAFVQSYFRQQDKWQRMNYYPQLGRLLIIFIIGISINSCSSDKINNISEFTVADNHTIELVAAEPDVILPVAMVEDSRNRLWVVEMPGYMRDIDGSDEQIPDGRIVILTDSDKDGRIDSRKIFIDSLENPRAICLINDGVLYSDGIQLKWSKIQNDSAKNTIVVDSFYVIGGNIEHQPNGLLYNLDNWIYSAKSNVRYRFLNGEWKKEATTFRGQWGISMDKLGRLVYNHNSAPLISDKTLPNQNFGNPFLELKYSTGKYLTEDMRIYPTQATTVNRGYLAEVLDSTGKVINYTSACAPHLYYGNAMDNKFQNSAFVCAPEGNLISNYYYDAETQTATRILEKKEFLVSNDESFRPVNLMTGFDGSLYIVDMRKGIIQHSAYMSSYLREKIKAKGLDKINGNGRIYRVNNNTNKTAPPNTHNLSSEDLMNLFFSDNLQLRIFAQKELIFRNDKNDLAALINIALFSDNPISQVHALWTLEGVQQMSLQFLLELTEKTNNPDLLAHIIALSKSFKFKKVHFQKLYSKSLALDSEHLDFLLASAIGQIPDLEHYWIELARKYATNPVLCEALTISISGRESYFLSKLDPEKNKILTALLHEVIDNKKSNNIQTPVLIEKPYDDDRTNGLKKFKLYCVSCHGHDGKGLKNQAPSLIESKIVDGEESIIASIILNGYSTDKSDYKIPMPAYKADPNLTDQDIVDIISYLKSTFTSDWNSLTIEEVEALRQ